MATAETTFLPVVPDPDAIALENWNPLETFDVDPAPLVNYEPSGVLVAPVTLMRIAQLGLLNTVDHEYRTLAQERKGMPGKIFQNTAGATALYVTERHRLILPGDPDAVVRPDKSELAESRLQHQHPNKYIAQWLNNVAQQGYSEDDDPTLPILAERMVHPDGKITEKELSFALFIGKFASLRYEPVMVEASMSDAIVVVNGQATAPKMPLNKRRPLPVGQAFAFRHGDDVVVERLQQIWRVQFLYPNKDDGRTIRARGWWPSQAKA